MASSATETVVSFTHGGESYEVDFLDGRDDGAGLVGVTA